MKASARQKISRHFLEALLGAIALFALVAPNAAAETVTIGSTAQGPGGDATFCDAGGGVKGIWVQDSVGTEGIPSYVVPSSGEITSWSTDQTGPNKPGASLALVVLSQGMSGDTLAAIDPEVLPNPLPPGGQPTTFRPPSPIPVQAGEVIGLFGITKESSCYFDGTESETDVVSYSPFESQPAVGSAVPLLGQAKYYRVDVSAELSSSGGGGGDPGGGNPAGTPSIESTGQPSTTRKGPKLEVDTGQKVRCAAGGNACSVDMTITSTAPSSSAGASSALRKKTKPKTVVVGKAHLSVAAGQSAELTFTLNKKGAALIAKKRKLKITVAVKVTQGSGAPVSSSQDPDDPEPLRRQAPQIAGFNADRRGWERRPGAVAFRRRPVPPLRRWRGKSPRSRSPSRRASTRQTAHRPQSGSRTAGRCLGQAHGRRWPSGWGAATVIARAPLAEARTSAGPIGYGREVIFDFRFKDDRGKWRSLGHRKGLTRDGAFASLEERAGRNSATEYMSRPRDGRTRKWDLFPRPEAPVDQSADECPRRRFYVACRAALDDGAIAKLARQGVYWGPGSPRRSRPTANRLEHFLTVEAENEEEAVERARGAVLGAGGKAPDLRLIGSKAG